MKHTKKQLSQEELLKNIIQSRRPDFTIPFPIGNRKESCIPIAELSYVESDGVISKFHYHRPEKETISVALTIGECEPLLGNYAFVRVHRSYIVNCACIEKMEWEREGILLTACGKQMPMSRRRKNEIQEYLQVLGLTHLL